MCTLIESRSGKHSCWSEQALCLRAAGTRKREAPPIDIKALHAKIGELTLENDFLEGALTKAGLLSAKR
jgi:hypothetical protein